MLKELAKVHHEVVLQGDAVDPLATVGVDQGLEVGQDLEANQGHRDIPSLQNDSGLGLHIVDQDLNSHDTVLLVRALDYCLLVFNLLL